MRPISSWRDYVNPADPIVAREEVTIPTIVARIRYLEAQLSGTQWAYEGLRRFVMSRPWDSPPGAANLEEPQVIRESFGYARPRLEGEANIQVGSSTRDVGVGTHVELAPAMDLLADTVLAEPSTTMVETQEQTTPPHPAGVDLSMEPQADAIMAESSGTTQEPATPPHPASVDPSTPVPPLPLPPSALTPSKYTPEPAQLRRAAPPRSLSPSPTPQVDNPTTSVVIGEVEAIVPSQTDMDEANDEPEAKMKGVDEAAPTDAGDKSDEEGDQDAPTEVEVKKDGMDLDTDGIEVVERRIGEVEANMEPGQIDE
jgi:hypothetical protein